jgi:hypothetical protein
VRYERFAEDLAASGGYDDLTRDAALSVFISAITVMIRASPICASTSPLLPALETAKRRSNSSRREFGKWGVHPILFRERRCLDELHSDSRRGSVSQTP